MSLKPTVWHVALTVAALLVPALPVAAQTRVERRAALKADGFVRIYNMAGSVKVTPWEKDSLLVTGDVVVPAGGDFFFGAMPEGAKLGVWTDLPVKEVKPSNLDVRVPRNSQVWVKTGSAETFVGDVAGGVDVNSVTGKITITGSPREAYAESLGGDIDIDVTTRSLRARTASGNIRIRGPIRDVTATTVSGNMTVEGDRFERGNFESVDGDIRYFGNIGTASAFEFINHSGTVEFTLPAAASAEFMISTFQGGFEDQFGVRAHVGESKLKGQEISFTVGNGGGQVTVRNFKGHIVLRRKG
jgi:hypothetical protein